MVTLSTPRSAPFVQGLPGAVQQRSIDLRVEESVALVRGHLGGYRLQEGWLASLRPVRVAFPAAYDRHPLRSALRLGGVGAIRIPLEAVGCFSLCRGSASSWLGRVGGL